MVYHVETEERSYNSVETAQQFQKIRKKWKDFSYVETAHRWDVIRGMWVPAGTKQFEYIGKPKQNESLSNQCYGGR